MRPLRDVPPHDEAGFSLPELLVTITLMAVISGAIIGSVVAVQRNLGVANAAMYDMSANRIAIERVASLLRGAVGPDGLLDETRTAVLAAEAGRARLYSVTGQAPQANPLQVEIAIVQDDATAQPCQSPGWCLVERIWEPDPAMQDELSSGDSPDYPGPPAQRVIARHLVSDEVFTYWTHVDDPLIPDSRCGRTLLAPVTAEADRALIDSISFWLQVHEPTGYDSEPSDLQGWARFASTAGLGYSASAASAGCLEDGGFSYSRVYTP